MSKQERLFPTVESPIRLNSEVDAILLHTFWLTRQVHKTWSENGQNVSSEVAYDKSSLSNELVARAAALIYYRQQKEGLKKPKLVIAGGKVKGPRFPAISAITREILIRRYGVLGEDIVTEVNSFTTQDEINTLSAHAQRNGWTNVLSISREPHQSSIQVYAGRQIPQSVKFRFKSINEVFDEYNDHQKIKDLTEDLSNSIYEIGFWGYESAKLMLMLFGNRMNEASRNTRQTKNATLSNEVRIHAIDSFRS